MALRLSVQDGTSFSEIWRLLANCYRTVSIRSIAEGPPDKKGYWTGLMVTAVATTQEPGEVAALARRDLETLQTRLSLELLDELGLTQIGLFHDEINASMMNDFVSNLAKGFCVVGGQKLALFRELYDIHTEPHLVAAEGDWVPSGRTSLTGFPFVAYYLSRKASTPPSPILERHLWRSRTDFLEVASVWFGNRSTPRNSAADVFLPIPVSLDTFRLSPNDLSMDLRANSGLFRKLRFVLKARGGEKESTVETFRLSIDDFTEIPTEEGISRFTAAPRFSSPLQVGNTVHLDIFPDNEVVNLTNSARLEPPTPQTTPLAGIPTILKIFLPPTLLKDTILTGKPIVPGEKDPALIFERAVHFLLCSLDIKSVHLGKNVPSVLRREDGLSQGDVDILAENPLTREIYAIQCTLQLPDDKKRDRAVNVARELSLRSGVPVSPIIVTPERAHEVGASNPRLRIIDGAELQALLKAVEEGNIGAARSSFLEASPRLATSS